MATIKAYTDISQSKKLAEILSPESADMKYKEYTSSLDYSSKYCDAPSIGPPFKRDIPCWSLAALLSVLDFPSLTKNKKDEWEVCVFDHDNDNYIEKTADNPVDACVAMIEKLHELKML